MISWDTIKDWLIILAALANIGSFFLGFRTGKKRERMKASQEQDQNNSVNTQYQRQTIQF